MYTRSFLEHYGVRSARNSITIYFGQLSECITHQKKICYFYFQFIFAGYRIGLRVDDAGTLTNLTNGAAKLANNVLSIPSTAGTAASSTAADGQFVTGLNGEMPPLLQRIGQTITTPPSTM